MTVLDRQQEAAMIREINGTRAVAGKRLLSRGWLITRYARRHARKQADAGRIFHGNPGVWLANHGGSWAWWGENVGCVMSTSGWISKLHTAFMNSPGHRANIIGRFTHVGVGYAVDERGIIFATIVFRR